MNRKQIIETLKGLNYNFSDEKLNTTLQYAIDHLSREWVSRKTHRKLVDTLNKDRVEWQKKAIDRKSEIDQLRYKWTDDVLNSEGKKFALKNEIDHLKIEKDVLQDALEKKNVEASGFSMLWLTETDKVSKLKTQNKWLIICFILYVLGFICLFIQNF